jgi:hypothetical protein
MPSLHWLSEVDVWYETSFATKRRQKEREVRRLSCYCTQCKMISTNSGGRHIFELIMDVFRSTTTAMCTMCCAGKGHSACVDEVQGLGAGTVRGTLLSYKTIHERNMSIIPNAIPEIYPIAGIITGPTLPVRALHDMTPCPDTPAYSVPLSLSTSESAK